MIMMLSNTQLKARLFELTEERDSLRNELSEAKDEITYLKNSNGDLKHRLDTRAEYLEELSKENRELKHKLKSRETKITEDTIDAVTYALRQHVQNNHFNF